MFLGWMITSGMVSQLRPSSFSATVRLSSTIAPMQFDRAHEPDAADVAQAGGTPCRRLRAG
jgi:hypothetical protein